ncbi:unnamed protein product [Kuraishia capsulata CBS 1993]|uniref:Protein PBN1 n=1 Tax=Kuraishia capsulata CBS 1993 TaxID=1382522 RepID=W6MW87_9ASCO|nr:uncharacterized protein KUCA_T00002992001 [Kuraishia capsulata CBS 1993]CDK27015.1 unnamed protein product [Kuraishia capsulata CBS 1993]
MDHRITFILDNKTDASEVFSKVKLTAKSLEIPAVTGSRQNVLRVPYEASLFGDWAAVFQGFEITYRYPEAVGNEILDSYNSAGLFLYLRPRLQLLDEEIRTIGSMLLQDLGLETETKFIATPSGFSSKINVGDVHVQQWLSSVFSRFAGEGELGHVDEFSAAFGSTGLNISFTSFDHAQPDTVYTKSGVKTEVGVFEREPRLSSVDSIAINGFRYALGDAQEKRTMLQFQRPHRLVPVSEVHTSLVNVPGLHPKLRLQFEGDLREPMKLAGSFETNSTKEPMCELFYHVNYPNDVYWDRYELKWLQAVDLIGLWGSDNLEQPQYANTLEWGSEILLRVDPGRLVETQSLEVPFHSRYALPGNSSDIVELLLGELFWGCDLKKPVQAAESLAGTTPIEREARQAKIDQFQVEVDALSHSPFDYTALGGYKSYFEPETVFYHVANAASQQTMQLEVPAAIRTDFNAIRYATLASVLLGTAYVVKCVLGRSQSRNPDRKNRKKTAETRGRETTKN